MKQSTRNILAFLYLTVGFSIFHILLSMVLFLLPIFPAGGGITVHSDQGVDWVQFDGIPGQYVALFFVKNADPKSIPVKGTVGAYNQSGTAFLFGNVYCEFISVILFSLLSIPILRRIFGVPSKANPAADG